MPTRSSNPTPSPQRAVLWDLDGTLIDTAAHHWQSWQAELSQHGRSLRKDEFQASFGKRNDSILRMWLRPDLSEAEIHQISESKEQRYREAIRASGIVLLPGVEMWLHRLHNAGWRQAVATMTGRANLDAILEMVPVRDLFQALVTAEQVQYGKPAPDIFLHAAKELAMPAWRCVVVEDSQAGLLAARRAGMHCIGVGTIEEGTADLTVASLADLPIDAFDRLVPALPGEEALLSG